MSQTENEKIVLRVEFEYMPIVNGLTTDLVWRTNYSGSAVDVLEGWQVAPGQPVGSMFNQVKLTADQARLVAEEVTASINKKISELPADVAGALKDKICVLDFEEHEMCLVRKEKT